MKRLINFSQIITLVLCVLIPILTGCTPISDPSPFNTSSSTLPNVPSVTQTIHLPSSTPQNTPLPSPSATLQLTPSPAEPVGCQEPSGNYERLTINGHQLNQRTYEMLLYASERYGGVIDITGDAITQGSYTNAVEASFGTHSGGGAVDLSVMAPGTYQVLEEDIDSLLRSLRLAGFAAWLRDFNELFPGSPIHIHAIAIGDRELSMAAREQLAGPHGYFWGYNGLPVESGLPMRDPHGGPLICEWMIRLGYPNKTATPSPDEDVP